MRQLSRAYQFLGLLPKIRSVFTNSMILDAGYSIPDETAQGAGLKIGFPNFCIPHSDFQTPYTL